MALNEVRWMWRCGSDILDSDEGNQGKPQCEGGVIGDWATNKGRVTTAPALK
jgi:hypothetical protein